MISGDLEGIAVVQHLREWTSTLVIILSVRDADADKVAALDAGAGNFLTKPFSTAELLARLRVVQRRAQPALDDPIVAIGGIQVVLTRRIVTRQGQPVKLTPTEYALLRLMVQHADGALDTFLISHPAILIRF